VRVHECLPLFRRHFSALRNRGPKVTDRGEHLVGHRNEHVPVAFLLCLVASRPFCAPRLGEERETHAVAAVALLCCVSQRARPPLATQLAAARGCGDQRTTRPDKRRDKAQGSRDNPVVSSARDAVPGCFPLQPAVCVATLQQGAGGSVNLLKSRVCSGLRCRKNPVFFGFTSKLNLLTSRCRKSPVFFGFTSKLNFDHFFFFERESFQSGTKVFFFSFPRSAP